MDNALDDAVVDLFRCYMDYVVSDIWNQYLPLPYGARLRGVMENVMCIGDWMIVSL